VGDSAHFSGTGSILDRAKESEVTVSTVMRFVAGLSAIALALGVSSCSAGVTPSATPSASQLDAADYINHVAVYLEPPDSVGGVHVSISFTNQSTKTIKYITFSVAPYNAVDDQVSSEIGGKSEARLRQTGPLASGESNCGYWKNVWYNGTIKSGSLVSVEIEYMDGQTVTLDGAGLGTSTMDPLGLVNCMAAAPQA
jgi:hypothetical protein